MIIKSFNLVHIIILLSTITLTIVASLLLRKKEQKTKDYIMIGTAIFNIIFFIIYKIWLSNDTSFEGFSIWKELPLQLCNINMFLIPLGIIFKNKYLLIFSFYVAPLGAFMALVFPDINFINNDIFMLRNIGYYGTHIIIFGMGLMLAPLGYVKPGIKNIPVLLLSAVVLSFIIFIVNVTLGAATGENVNYFYAMDPAGISILELFWSLIPIKYIYLLPAVLILTVYVLIVDLIYRGIFLINRKMTKKLKED